ncbi:tyrosine-type recombinase/integrase [Luteibacter sp. dw_328]|uniref:tyrosine-type recombinase/integrase n=1 Tax=Luteibacter sp. dw_328 TaxID=2719796 RepID=UPI001BD6BE0F|nr:tyrosine-type recombinase/integrase [Luteibacter sp. dw_328]
MSKPTDTANHAGFPDLNARPLASLKPEHFSGALHSLASRLFARGVGPALGGSVRRLMFFGPLFGRARTECRIEIIDPLQRWKDLDLPPASPGRERVLSDTEWKWVRAAILGERGKSRQLRTSMAVRLAIYTGRFTAARRAEVVKLDWKDVDLVAGTAHLRDTKSKNKNKKGHTARSRTIPLPAEVVRRLAWLKRRMEANHVPVKGAVFQWNGRRISLDPVTNTWVKGCEKPVPRVRDCMTSATPALLKSTTSLAIPFRLLPSPVTRTTAH